MKCSDPGWIHVARLKSAIRISNELPIEWLFLSTLPADTSFVTMFSSPTR